MVIAAYLTLPSMLLYAGTKQRLATFPHSITYATLDPGCWHVTFPSFVTFPLPHLPSTFRTAPAP